MVLRAKKDGPNLVFELEGHLDFETTQKFKDTCSSELKDKPTDRVIFYLKGLKFVGSSGISTFIQTLTELNKKKNKPRMVGASIEFQKMFRAYQTTRNPFQIYETMEEAEASFDAPASRRGRKKTLDN